MTDALDEMKSIECQGNCRAVLEGVIKDKPESVVVLYSKGGEMAGYQYCATPAAAVLMIELGKLHMLEDMMNEGEE